MDLVITLPSELSEKLRKHAADLGQDASTFAVQALRQKLDGPRTLDEILAPFRKQVAESGMDAEELDAFYENLRNEVWQDRKEDL